MYINLFVETDVTIHTGRTAGGPASGQAVLYLASQAHIQSENSRSVYPAITK